MRLQEALENIEASTINRVVNQGFLTQVLRGNPVVLGERVLISECQYGLVPEKWYVRHYRIVRWVGGDDKVNVTPPQSFKWLKMKARGEVNFDVRPVIPELVDCWHQPLKATMTLDCHVQPAIVTGFDLL